MMLDGTRRTVEGIVAIMMYRDLLKAIEAFCTEVLLSYIESFALVTRQSCRLDMLLVAEGEE